LNYEFPHQSRENITGWAKGCKGFCKNDRVLSAEDRDVCAVKPCLCDSYGDPVCAGTRFAKMFSQSVEKKIGAKK
jgi:hypothetical protein